MGCPPVKSNATVAAHGVTACRDRSAMVVVAWVRHRDSVRSCRNDDPLPLITTVFRLFGGWARIAHNTSISLRMRAPGIKEGGVRAGGGGGGGWGGCTPSPKIVYVTIQASLSGTLPPVFIINPMVRQRMREAGVKGEGIGGGGGGFNPENNLRHIQSLPFRHPSAVEEGCRKPMLIVHMRDRRLWGRNGVGFRAPRFPVSWDTPEGGQGCLISASCLESQGCQLIPLSYFLSHFFCPVLLPCLVIFLLPVRSPDFFRKSLTFKKKKRITLFSFLFCMAIIELLGDDSWQMVCATCCHMALVFAIMCLHLFYFLLFLSIPFLRLFFHLVSIN